MVNTPPPPRVLSPEEKNRAIKAAALLSIALRLKVTVRDLQSAEARQRIITESPWDGASIACWELVTLNLVAVETARGWVTS